MAFAPFKLSNFKILRLKKKHALTISELKIFAIRLVQRWLHDKSTILINLLLLLILIM